MYLQVSTINQALIFFTRSCRWSFMERPGFLLVFDFLVTQLIATLITVYVDWRFTTIKGIGWGWDGVTWLYNIVFYLPLDVIKFLIRYMMRGRAWDLDLERRIVFMRKKDFRQEERELKWAIAQRTIGGLQPTESTTFHGMNNYIELNQLTAEAHGRAEIARLRELNTLKGRTKLVVRLKGLNLETIRQSYSVLLANGDIEALVTYAR